MKVGIFLPVLFVCLQSDAQFLSANDYEPLPPPPKPPTPGPPPNSALKLAKGRWWCDACERSLSNTYPKSKHNQTAQHQDCQINVDIYDEVNGIKSKSFPHDDDADDDDADDEDDSEWEGICNEDYQEWKAPGKICNTEHRLILTYGGGPSGGFFLVKGGGVGSWHSEPWSPSLQIKHLHGYELLFRMAPGCDGSEGAQGWQVKLNATN